jgi:uncharacterized transporter YbjL
VIVILGVVSAPLIGWLALFDRAAVLGIFSGASVNMPSLGAATQTLNTLPKIAPDLLALPALACAVTFPTAIVGSIGTLLLLKQIFHIDLARGGGFCREKSPASRAARTPHARCRKLKPCRALRLMTFHRASKPE